MNNASKGLTFDAETGTWKTHAENGAVVSDPETMIREMNKDTPERINLALVVWRQWKFILAEFNAEWEAGRRKF